MPQRHCAMVAGGYYHIYNRGANRNSIFRCQENYRYILYLLARYCSLLDVSMIAYCLMPNHFHWLVRQGGDTAAGLLAQRVCKAYSNAFNNYYQHSGTLFEGPYKAISVNTDEYLHQLCRYIHLNPVRHGFIADPACWPYSNYQEWIGTRHDGLIDKEFVHEHFPIEGAYQAYVESYLRGEVILPKSIMQYMHTLEEE